MPDSFAGRPICWRVLPIEQGLWDLKKQFAEDARSCSADGSATTADSEVSVARGDAFALNDQLAGRSRRSPSRGDNPATWWPAGGARNDLYPARPGDVLRAFSEIARSGSSAEFEENGGLFRHRALSYGQSYRAMPLSGLPGSVRQTVLAALEHQDYPTLRLMQRLRPPRDLSRPPLCQAMFVLDKPHRVTGQAAQAFARGETGLRVDLGDIVLETIH